MFSEGSKIQQYLMVEIDCDRSIGYKIQIRIQLSMGKIHEG